MDCVWERGGLAHMITEADKSVVSKLDTEENPYCRSGLSQQSGEPGELRVWLPSKSWQAGDPGRANVSVPLWRKITDVQIQGS